MRLQPGWWVLCVVGCGPTIAVDGDGSSSDGAGTSTTTSTSTSSPTSTSTGTSTVTTVGDVTTAVDAESSEGGQFIIDPDGGICFTHCGECDVWSQDCSEGFKCVPWANDGGDQWNATACRELDRSPAQPGDPCTIDGAPASGIDDCDISSLCWDVDADTGVGACVPFCSGSEANPICDDGTACWIGNEGVLVLCLPTCDPLSPMCGDGLSCVADDVAFFCRPAEHVPQEYGAPCEHWLGCGTGLVCAGEGSTPECVDSCCTASCDLAAPVCPDEAVGQSCVPYFEPGAEPPGLANVGVCIIE